MIKGEVPIDRNEMLDHILDNPDSWDCIIIGGGATGVEQRCMLLPGNIKPYCLEQGDFAQGTSSRSTELVHGGCRGMAE